MITEIMLDNLREELREKIDPFRFAHTLGVEKEMRAMAARYMPDKIAQAAAAGLLHDVTKAFSAEEQFSYCAANGLAISEDEAASYRVLHAKTGAHYVKTRYPAFADAEILHAIERHTVAAMDMTTFDIMLYLADFIEEGRTYEDCVALRRLYYDGIERGKEKDTCFLRRIFLKALDLSLQELLKDGRSISLETVRARNRVLAFFAEEGKK